ncbi:uncharacterized protein CEXT_590501 [Caerostris extrusa]|uniref:Uncharacterized protein n=1 Tax=Caerostris extrusa TaxID=172846 RepID=A0AAV4T414_CAEEX|nr:uncharacterized protein CEXT_590501 [Caerostris extrusa]
MHSDSFAEKTPQTNYGARKKTYHPNRNNNRNVPVVRHEIRVIHVNEPGPSSEVCRDCRHANPPNRVENILPHSQNKRMTQKSNHEIQNSAVLNRRSGKQTDETDDMCEKLENLSLNPSAAPSRTDALATIFDINSMENGTLLLRFGTEMSEMIAGSHVTMNAFLGVYNEWIDLRRVTMLLFEELEKNLSDSGNRNKRIKDVLQCLGTGAKIVQYVPVKTVAIAGQVIGAIIDFISKLFSPTAMKSIGLDNLDNFQLRLALKQDIEATGDIYMHCLQCDQQFQETCKLIEQFYQKIQNGYFDEFKEIFETNFLKEMSQFSPQNPDVFYKRLKTCYKRLQENQVSGLGEAFCKAFEDWPDVMTTISRLHRRFNSEMWDDTAVVKAWQEIYQLLQDENSIVADVIDKVHNCILVLISQRSIMDKYAMDLQKQI